MSKAFLSFGLWCASAACLAVSGVARTRALSGCPEQNTSSMARVTIQVTGGEKDTPIENASVYLKYVEERKIGKDKRYELNVKTNREGVAHIPDAPLGPVLIQIVADGWKTFGRRYDITDTKEPIKIHLDRPPKWY